MSHFTTIKTQIRDIEALRLASTELGLSLLQNANARGYSSNTIKGDYVIRLKGPYDIAVQKQKDSSFGFTSDLWGGHVEQEVGKNYVACSNFTPSTKPPRKLAGKATSSAAVRSRTAASNWSSPQPEPHP